MNLDAVTEAATTMVKSATAQTGLDLPKHSRSLQIADFERLMAQAQGQQAQVQLANPVGELGQPVGKRVASTIDASNTRYKATMEASHHAIGKLDYNDPASVASAVQHFNQAVAANAQMSIMMIEVSSARKSLGELFRNQG